MMGSLTRILHGGSIYRKHRRISCVLQIPLFYTVQSQQVLLSLAMHDNCFGFEDPRRF